jgi:hypothetical protein
MATMLLSPVQAYRTGGQRVREALVQRLSRSQNNARRSGGTR